MSSFDGASKFFGTPNVPLEWNGDFCDDELFFGENEKDLGTVMLREEYT